MIHIIIMYHNVKLLFSYNAKKNITSSLQKMTECNSKKDALIFVDHWNKHENVKAYIYQNKRNEILSFAIMHKIDNNYPFILNLVYTDKKYRQLGISSQILQYIKKNENEISCCCYSNKSFNFLKKNGFIFHGFKDIGNLPYFK